MSVPGQVLHERLQLWQQVIVSLLLSGSIRLIITAVCVHHTFSPYGKEKRAHYKSIHLTGRVTLTIRMSFIRKVKTHKELVGFFQNLWVHTYIYIWHEYEEHLNRTKKIIKILKWYTSMYRFMCYVLYILMYKYKCVQMYACTQCYL